MGASPGYDAIDDRRAIGAGVQEGVMEAGCFEVTQRAAGANLSVDIAAGTAGAANGVAAYVQGDSVTAQGLYPVPPHSAATINEAVTTAHATLPRVDIVVLEVQDNVHDASGQNRAQVRVIPGTATSGATLDNRTGAPSLPSNCLLLADVHVPAADTTISNSQIRDRRKWARGANKVATSTGGANYTTTSASLAEIDATNLKPRIECSGVPIEVELTGSIENSSSSVNEFDLLQDGSAVTASQYRESTVSANADSLRLIWRFTPSAGSHTFSPRWSTNAGTLNLFNSSNYRVKLTVREVVRQETANNVNTTG